MLIGVPAVLGAIAVFLWVAGLIIHHNYVLLMACGPVTSGTCRALSYNFNSTDWTMDRARQTIATLAIVAVTVTVAAWAFSEVFAWFFKPFLAQQHLTVLNSIVFTTHGIAFGAWTLLAFSVGVLAGMYLRRTVPAMAVTLGVYAGLAILTWTALRRHYPVSGFWPMQLVEGGWLLALSIVLFTATIWLVRRRAA